MACRIKAHTLDLEGDLFPNGSWEFISVMCVGGGGGEEAFVYSVKQMSPKELLIAEPAVLYIRKALYCT